MPPSCRDVRAGSRPCQRRRAGVPGRPRAPGASRDRRVTAPTSAAGISVDIRGSPEPLYAGIQPSRCWRNIGDDDAGAGGRARMPGGGVARGSHIESGRGEAVGVRRARLVVVDGEDDKRSDRVRSPKRCSHPSVQIAPANGYRLSGFEHSECRIIGRPEACRTSRPPNRIQPVTVIFKEEPIRTRPRMAAHAGPADATGGDV
jgi:hypothetical protein